METNNVCATKKALYAQNKLNLNHVFTRFPFMSC